MLAAIAAEIEELPLQNTALLRELVDWVGGRES